MNSVEIELPCTISISSEKLEKVLKNEENLDLPDFPNHSQSVERAVKLVSEASKSVYGKEKRHKFILTKNLSRKENKRSTVKMTYFI